MSTPWGGADRGPCEKCEGSGMARHRCLSCIEATAPDLKCVTCGGKVTWVDTRPSCEGGGQVTRVKRAGISSFPTLAGLLRYLGERDVDLSGDVFLELEGELSSDRDLDADEGAILIFPKRIVAIRDQSTV